jgi:hypothetical protein
MGGRYMDRYKETIERAKTHWQEHDQDTAALVTIADELYTLWVRARLAQMAIERELHDLEDTNNVTELRATLREIWRINANAKPHD